MSLTTNTFTACTYTCLKNSYWYPHSMSTPWKSHCGERSDINYLSTPLSWMKYRWGLSWTCQKMKENLSRRTPIPKRVSINNWSVPYLISLPNSRPWLGFWHVFTCKLPNLPALYTEWHTSLSMQAPSSFFCSKFFLLPWCWVCNLLSVTSCHSSRREILRIYLF